MKIYLSVFGFFQQKQAKINMNFTGAYVGTIHDVIERRATDLKKQGKSHKWWTKKFEISTTMPLKIALW
jgi:hypothetical protein